MKFSYRTVFSIITFILLVIIVIASWEEIMHAFRLLEKVNLWILALLIPVQFVAYYAAGEMMFEYLRGKGELKKVSRLSVSRMALELNFVNHVLPSGGVSGASYMTWRLGKYGVQSGRAVMSQVVRHVAAFAAFLTALIVSVVIVTLDAGINRVIILSSSVLACMIIFVVIFGIYILSSKSRLHSFSRGVVKTINGIVKKVTFGKKKKTVEHESVEKFFTELHDDYVELSHDKKLLIKPYLWGLVFVIADVALFMIGFWAFGFVVNPAPIVIAYGLAGIASFILFTPGGTGAYEAIMVSFLATAGLPQGVAIAGIVLTRVILLVGTILSGYVFYQLALLRYGKNSS